MAFKMNYNKSSFPFKSGEIKTVVDKKEGKGPRENVDLDKELTKEKMNIVRGDYEERLKYTDLEKYDDDRDDK